MNTRVLRAAALTCCVLVPGCAPTTCEELCLWFDEASEGRNWEPPADCEATCEHDYSQAGNYCRNSLYDLSRCVEDGEGYGEDVEPTTAEGCAEEIQNARDDCACGMEPASATCGAINSAR